METFIYGTLNSSSRNQDQSRIQTLGPLSYALAKIVWSAERKRPDDNQSLPNRNMKGEWLTLYRGLKLTADEI